MTISLFIDIVVALLLAVTIGYAVVLNKRLGSLRRDRGELEKLAVNFHASTERADDSIARLKSSVAGLQEQIGKAESMRDDLIFLTERGGSAADRLEEMVRQSRGDAPIMARSPTRQEPVMENTPAKGATNSKPPGLKATASDRIDSEPVSEAEKELLKALRSAS
ncbi:MAG: hypothetical protein HQ483_08885 [Rhodospirillales bacterium]|nr:hypothetical protein [Rhodospirillales bacterium]